jgi:hypothetical protein
MAEQNSTTLRKAPRPACASIGERFGRVVVHSVLVSKGVSTATCVCDCGVVKGGIKLNGLRSGLIKSCGCLGLETRLQPTHGMSRKGEYGIWRSMRRRCLSPLDKDYPHYGGRGITVCRQWNESFLNFWNDMGPRPSPAHSIDRKDNDGPYSADNCQWATPMQQTRNRPSYNRRITINGKTEVLAYWLIDLGIRDSTFRGRVARGMTDAEALTTPIACRFPRKPHPDSISPSPLPALNQSLEDREPSGK